MPKGSCDPAPATYNEVTLAKGNNTVAVTVLWEWDGVSTFPDCAGPIREVRLRNSAGRDWTLHIPKSTRATTATVTAGATRTVTGAELTAFGLTKYADVTGVRLT